MPRRTGLPLGLAALFYGSMAAVACALSWWLLGRWPVAVGPGPAWPPATALLAGVGVGLLLVVTSRVLDRSFAWSRRLTDAFRGALGRVTPAQAVALAALSSVGEELLFRGVLLPLLGLWGSSLLFGAVHFVPQRDWLPWALLAAVVGLLFGALALATGSVVAPVAAHFVVNWLNLLALGAERAGRADGRSPL
jgi:membrane protease YdiL (CAAX protease family)